MLLLILCLIIFVLLLVCPILNEFNILEKKSGNSEFSDMTNPTTTITTPTPTTRTTTITPSPVPIPNFSRLISKIAKSYQIVKKEISAIKDCNLSASMKLQESRLALRDLRTKIKYSELDK